MNNPNDWSKSVWTISERTNRGTRWTERTTNLRLNGNVQCQEWREWETRGIFPLTKRRISRHRHWVICYSCNGWRGRETAAPSCRRWRNKSGKCGRPALISSRDVSVTYGRIEELTYQTLWRTYTSCVIPIHISDHGREHVAMHTLM